MTLLKFVVVTHKDACAFVVANVATVVADVDAAAVPFNCAMGAVVAAVAPTMPDFLLGTVCLLLLLLFLLCCASFRRARDFCALNKIGGVAAMVSVNTYGSSSVFVLPTATPTPTLPTFTVVTGVVFVANLATVVVVVGAAAIAASVCVAIRFVAAVFFAAATVVVAVVVMNLDAC